jgi:hypothetical protein
MTTSSTLRRIVPAITALLIAACQSAPAPSTVPTPGSGTAAASPAAPSTAATTAPAPTPMGLRMTSIRAQGTATLLADGAVLVVGGFRGDGANNTADVYEPSIRSFRPTGKLAAARYWHTATPMQDGRVLLIGGTGSGRSPVSAAELWDPDTETFTVAGQLPEPRTLHTATRLLDGRVLVVGGLTPDTKPIAAALLWDPATSTFRPAGSLAHARAWHTAALLPDGRVLIAGGPADAEVWDPKTMTFSAAGKLATPRWWGTSTALPDGRVLVIGGLEGETFDADAGVVATAELWDPATSTFRAAGSLAHGRALHAAVLLRDGRTAVIGGAVSPGPAGPLPSTWVEIWDPTIEVAGAGTIAFGGSASLTVARVGAMAALLNDGTILVAGGADERGVGIGSAELLGPFAP